MVLVPHDGLQVEGRGVVKLVFRLADQERFGVDAGLGALRQLGHHGGFGGGEDAVEAAEDGEGEDDLAVFGLLEVAAEEVGDRPDESGEALIGHAADGGKGGSTTAGWFGSLA